MTVIRRGVIFQTTTRAPRRTNQRIDAWCYVRRHSDVADSLEISCGGAVLNRETCALGRRALLPRAPQTMVPSPISRVALPR